MKKIESFTVDHLNLFPGLYVSRKDEKKGAVVTTFDLRFVAPNHEPAMEIAAMHTIEHLGATFFRNSKGKEDILYFGPMGCRTGFYLLIFGDLTPTDVFDSVVGMCDFILSFEGEIPGATAKECGNFAEHDLTKAKEYIAKYRAELTENKRTIYPQ